MRKLGITGLVVLCGCLSLSSCSFFKRLIGSSGGAEKDPAGEQEPQVERSMQLVGEIASVHEGEEGFVLIRRFGGGGLPQGFVFHSRGSSGQTASLRPTGERLGKFYAADITGGTPTAGDLVLARRLPEAAEAPSTPTLQAPKPGFQTP